MKFTSDVELALVTLIFLAGGGGLWLYNAYRMGSRKKRETVVLACLVAALCIAVAVLTVLLRTF